MLYRGEGKIFIGKTFCNSKTIKVYVEMLAIPEGTHDHILTSFTLSGLTLSTGTTILCFTAQVWYRYYKMALHIISQRFGYFSFNPY